MTTAAAPRPIRLGIIGTGLAVEKLHWPALRQMPDRYTIVAFANHTRPKAEAFAAYSGASMNDYYADYEDLLRRDDVEAVLISLPIPLNEPVTRACLQAGKHVICEKPTGADRRQGEAFLGLADRYRDRKVLIAENFFYRDDLRLARSLLDAGVIGRLHLMSWRVATHLVPREGEFSSTPWRQEPEYVGGPHLDAGVHHISQIRLLCGDAQVLHGEIQDANTTMGGPSDMTLNLRFVSGAIGNYTAVHSEVPVPPEDSGMYLYGTEAVMTIGRRRISIYRPDGSVEERHVESDGGYYNEFLNFYDAVVHDEPIIGTIEQSYHNMLIVLGGLESAETKKVVAMTAAPGGLAEQGVPFWQPRAASDPFEGLPCQIRTEVRQP